MLSIFLAPVSATININHYELTLEKKSTKVLAQATTENWWFQWTTALGLGGGGISGGHTSLAACEAARTAKEAEGNGNTFTAGPCTQGEDPSGIFNGQVLAPTDGYSLGCNLTRFSLTGCFAEFFYLIWEITAKLARLAGQFLDFFVYYSTNDQSYRAEFVEKGWAVVRDIANLFFIIALIYVAIKTILDMGHSNSKKMVATIIMIALIINFSLFVTKVVIDGSNILAKIFYNNITPVDKNGSPLTAENGGEKSISVGMIDKYDPQELITQDQYDEIGAGWFIFTTIILTLITFYTAYVFLTVALLFVARVVSLWIAMIFSPLAFASLTLPEVDMGDMSYKKWWSDLIGNAILAPFFIFFLYIIVLFLDVKNFISYDGTGDTFQKIMKVVIPFMITTGLLMKAKEVAVKYSGEMGKNIVKAGAAVGTLALGATALGAAAVGRGTIGATTKYIRNEDARKRDADIGSRFKNQFAGGRKLSSYNPLAYAKILGKGAAANAANLAHKIPAPLSGGKTIGGALSDADNKFEHAKHAKHTLDEKTKEEHGEGTKFSDLLQKEQDLIIKKIEFDEMAKTLFRAKKYDNLKSDEKRFIEEQYNLGERAITETNGQKNVRQLNAKEHSEGEHILELSKAKLGLGEFAQALRKGSYDIRNLPDTKASQGGFNKTTVGVASVLAFGMRAGLKNSLGVNPGTGKADTLKDIGNVLAAALKGFDISLPSGGGSKGGGEHNDGGHGGGGHH